jgi:hypothetical protein
MSCTTYATPCWRIVLPDGEDYDQGDGVPHYDTEKDAAADIASWDLKAPKARPERFDAPCVTVSCDGDGCDSDPGAEEVFTRLHVDSVEAARKLARDSDWTVTDDGRFFCWDCPAELDDEDEDERAEIAATP